VNTNIIKAISSETRINILLQIEKGGMCACKIPPLVRKTQPAVSQHLSILRKAGLLKSKRDGVKITYSLTKKGKHVLNDIKRW